MLAAAAVPVSLPDTTLLHVAMLCYVPVGFPLLSDTTPPRYDYGAPGADPARCLLPGSAAAERYEERKQCKASQAGLYL